MILNFTNAGEIDIRGATVAGLSAKTTSSAIGEFGTGLKYAIACILRWKGGITIHSGLTVHTFFTREEDYRGKPHDFIFMQTGTEITPLGFTTHYGAKWEPWQVYRELLCNARDEGGDVTTDQPTPAPNLTIVSVDCNQLTEPHTLKDKIVLPANWTPDLTEGVIRAKHAPSQFLYHKGVRIFDKPCVATWNTAGNAAQLSEDRQLANFWWYRDACAKALATSTNRNLIFACLTAGEDTFEHSMSFPSYAHYSQEFLDIAEREYRKHPEHNARLRAVLTEHRPAAMEKSSLDLSPRMTNALTKALAFLARLPEIAPHISTYTITVADLGNNTLGQFNRTNQKIYLSPEVFNQGVKQIVSTLYEEFTHAITDKDDLTYDMQTYLFNTIIGLHEDRLGEVL